VWAHSVTPAKWTIFTTSKDSLWHFSWWANGVGFSLLEFDSLRGDSINSVTWLKTMPVIGGVHESAALNAVSAYPNPSSGKFIISMPNTITSATAEIYSVLGEKIFTAPVTGGKEGSVDLSKQPNGVYYLQIRSREGIAARKLVVNR